MIVRFICAKQIHIPIDQSPLMSELGEIEEAVMMWAKDCARRGHKAEVYHNGPTGTFESVSYKSRGAYTYAEGLTINIMSPDIKPQALTWYLTYNLDDAKLYLTDFEGVLLPSRWAVDNFKVKPTFTRIDPFGKRYRNVHYLPHGYDKKQIYPGTKIPKQCLFAAPADKGLDAVLAAWPKVYQAHPDATLLLATASSTDLPGIAMVQDLSAENVNKLFRESDIWVYPSMAEEFTGLGAIKAQAAGCVPIYFPTIALAEIIKQGIKSSPDKLADDWIDILNDAQKRDEIRKQLANEYFADWAQSTSYVLDCAEKISFVLEAPA